MTALDGAARIVEENGRELAESFLSAAPPRRLASRGRSHESHLWQAGGALVAHVPPNPAIDVIRAMSLEEKLELLRRLQGGELAETASAVPIVEAVPPTA
jgi:hypothetical protein